jgi:hypothetical protein
MVPQYWILEPFIYPVKVVDEPIHEIMDVNEINVTLIKDFIPPLAVNIHSRILISVEYRSRCTEIPILSSEI